MIEFICPSCSLSWTHRVAAVENAPDTQSCKRCSFEVARQGLPSSLAIQRAGTNAATTDHLVGQDAAVLWDEFHGKKEVRDTVRKELGTPALTQNVDGSYSAATPERISERKEAYKFLNE